MDRWLTWVGLALGALAGAWLPLDAEDGAYPSAPASSSRGEAVPAAGAPRLRGQAQPQVRGVAPDALPVERAPRPERVQVIEPALDPPQRPWEPILADRSLEPLGRATRLLALAEELSRRDHADHAARTLDLVEERLPQDAPFRARVRLARAWNDHRRGDEEGATAIAEAVAKDASAPSSVRARGAYACLLFAFGLGQGSRAREALGLLAEHATPAEHSMLQDARRRFAGLLTPDEER